MLCRLAELPEGSSRGLLRVGNEDRVFAVRQGDEVFVWRNACPHNQRPLEFRQDRFLSAGGEHIVCFAHGAHFEIRTGFCFAGPCWGDRLESVAVCVEDGAVWIDEALAERLRAGA
jgi:nitrite reductase/ring-hydroxylating ferredoxin subunit